MTESLNGHSFDWAFAEVGGTVPKIAQQRTRSDSGKICHHVAACGGRYVSSTCWCAAADAVPGQAGKIAEQIAAKASQS